MVILGLCGIFMTNFFENLCTRHCHVSIVVKMLHRVNVPKAADKCTSLIFGFSYELHNKFMKYNVLRYDVCYYFLI